MLSFWRAGDFDRATDVEFLKLEVSFICLRQSVMDRAGFMQQSCCYDTHQTSLSAFGYSQQQVNFIYLCRPTGIYRPTIKPQKFVLRDFHRGP